MVSIYCESGYGWKNKDRIGKSDPYCQISIDGETKKTRQAKNQGTQASWGETLNFSRGGPGSMMQVSVMDDDVGKDDVLGRGTGQVPYLSPGQSTPITITLSPAGTVTLYVSEGQRGGQGGYGRHSQCPACGKPEDGSYHGCILSQAPKPRHPKSYGNSQRTPHPFYSGGVSPRGGPYGYGGQPNFGYGGPQTQYGGPMQFGGPQSYYGQSNYGPGPSPYYGHPAPSPYYGSEQYGSYSSSRYSSPMRQSGYAAGPPYGGYGPMPSYAGPQQGPGWQPSPYMSYTPEFATPRGGCETCYRQLRAMSY
eukprot:NODE_2646_length_1150_cov_162.047230_g2424_i0.p1 GENE.NODE_2646_length_1150_cov_162.047230_g2424_i0~~NODE_2646_length_1150_cov_162.047230_g2424_i0.p1  ORF type:complete len:307 (-),score=25.96 NODE_2646_length_1150_cov_162.047230_g2424_i0:91-1011(-)